LQQYETIIMGTVPPLLSPALSPHSFPISTSNNPSASYSFAPESYSLSFSPSIDHNDFAFNQALKANGFIQHGTNGSFENLQNGGLMIEDVKARPRNMSMSSGTDREQSIEAKPRRKASSAADGENSRSSKKRSLNDVSDTIDYPRRRATIAVCLQVLHDPVNHSYCREKLI
jgi:hypothetical protein